MITGNEPAMPFESKTMTNLSSEDFTGLTIRQHFAGLCMQGLLAAWGNHDVTSYDELANDAVIAADALIAELNKIN